MLSILLADRGSKFHPRIQQLHVDSARRDFEHHRNTAYADDFLEFLTSFVEQTASQFDWYDANAAAAAKRENLAQFTYLLAGSYERALDEAGFEKYGLEEELRPTKKELAKFESYFRRRDRVSMRYELEWNGGWSKIFSFGFQLFRLPVAALTWALGRLPWTGFMFFLLWVFAAFCDWLVLGLPYLVIRARSGLPGDYFDTERLLSKYLFGDAATLRDELRALVLADIPNSNAYVMTMWGLFMRAKLVEIMRVTRSELASVVPREPVGEQLGEVVVAQIEGPYSETSDVERSAAIERVGAEARLESSVNPQAVLQAPDRSSAHGADERLRQDDTTPPRIRGEVDQRWRKAVAGVGLLVLAIALGVLGRRAWIQSKALVQPESVVVEASAATTPAVPDDQGGSVAAQFLENVGEPGNAMGTVKLLVGGVAKEFNWNSTTKFEGDTGACCDEPLANWTVSWIAEGSGESAMRTLTRVSCECMDAAKALMNANSTIERVQRLAAAVEAYGLDNKRYPEGTIADVERSLTPKYLGYFTSTDAWENPLIYVTNADGSQYRIVSSGADGQIEAQSTILEATNSTRLIRESLDSDIVVQNGMFIAFPSAVEAHLRQVAENYPIPTASVPEEAKVIPDSVVGEALPTQDGASIHLETMERVYYTQVKEKLSPTYIRDLPRFDGWGRAIEFRVEKAEKGKAAHYAVSSNGANGSPAAGLRADDPDPGADIVFTDGSFISYPKPRTPEVKGTMDSLRTIATAWEAYATDIGSYY